MNNFHYVGVLLDMLYGINIDEENLEEIGLIAWGLIGNKNIKLYRYCTSVGSDLSIQLPCNVDKIEAITTDFEDWNRVTNKSDYGDLRSAVIEQSIENLKFDTDPLYISGTFVKYEKVGDTLYFQHPYNNINILYKGVLMDEDGLPELTDKEATAIATYIAYITKFKEGLITNNTQITNQAYSLKKLWDLQCDLARVTYLSQNDMNLILDVKGRWDRHSYSKSYKPKL